MSINGDKENWYCPSEIEAIVTKFTDSASWLTFVQMLYQSKNRKSTPYAYATKNTVTTFLKEHFNGNKNNEIESNVVIDGVEFIIVPELSFINKTLPDGYVIITTDG